jgi:hypothetical protein
MGKRHMIRRYTVVTLALSVMIAWCRQEPKLTPRELFYSAPSAPAPAAAQTKKPPVQRTAKSKPAPARSEPLSAESRTPAPAKRVEQAEIIPVSTKSYAPLGLRYSLLKVDRGSAAEVAIDEVFRAGDRIRLSVEANDSGYLYIVTRGSSGVWKALFPSPEIEGGSNLVERGRRYEIPSGYTFTFDEQPGAEKLFIVLSRRPEPDLEKLIYSLGQRSPAEETPQERAPKMLLAQSTAPIDDALIGKLRTYSRDLIIEKVDATTPGPRAEKAVYAVNTTGAADSRVVADVTLQHK